MSTNHTQRNARDAVVGLLIALAPFAYKQFTLGRPFVSALTVIVMAALVLVYRYADAKAIEAALDDADAEELKPVLRRLGRRVRRWVSSRRE